MSETVDNKPLTILQWAEADRPREKLALKGKASLSDAELIAILIGSGTKSLSAVEVAKLILKNCNNDINMLAKQSISDLIKNKGIGEAKAIAIISALELGRRRKSEGTTKLTPISNSRHIFELMMPVLTDLPHEEFWIILLNRANIVIKTIQISKGGVAGTVVDSKIIFKNAIEFLANSVILVHNHPSGNLKPSQEDITITKKLKQQGTLIEIPILDHIIFTNSNYYSFADEGQI